MFGVAATLTLCCLLAGGVHGAVILELDSEVPGDPGFYGNCTTWFELYPNWGNIWHWEGYDDLGKLPVEDNGDGYLSPCDRVNLGGMSWHVIYHGPTFLTASGGHLEPFPSTSTDEPFVYEPGNPVCQTWTLIEEGGFSEEIHIDDWIDGDASGTVTVCDMIIVGGNSIHIVGEKPNMHVTDPQVSPAQQRAWNKIKALFSQLF